MEVDTCSLKQQGKRSELKLHRRSDFLDFLVIFHWIGICLVCWFLLLLGWLFLCVCVFLLFWFGFFWLLLLDWFCFVLFLNASFSQLFEQCLVVQKNVSRSHVYELQPFTKIGPLLTVSV